jgi:hypothetical protein
MCLKIKNQHYIPQFYLRNFSRDKKQIAFHNIKSDKTYLSPIASTCQEKYFYGKDSGFEEYLSTLELRQAEVIKTLVPKN